MKKRPGDRPTPLDVLPKLAPHYPLLLDILNDGLRAALTMVKAAADVGVLTLPSRCRTDALTSCAVEIAKARCAAGSPLKYRPEARLEVFELDGVLFSLKRGRRNRVGLAQNHPSKQQSKLRSGENVFNFPGEPPFVYLVYKPDPSMTGFDAVAISCPKGYDDNEWSEPILDARGEVELFPVPPKPVEPTKVVAKAEEKPETEIHRKASSGADGRSA